MELNQNNIIILCLVGLSLAILIVYKHFKDDIPEEVEVKVDLTVTAVEKIEDDIEIKQQPDLTELGENWAPFDVIETIGNFEIYSPTADEYKWRLRHNGETVLTSKASYMSDTTCRHGIASAKKVGRDSMRLKYILIVGEDKLYKVICKAKNGKIIGASELILAEDQATNVLNDILLAITV